MSAAPDAPIPVDLPALLRLLTAAAKLPLPAAMAAVPRLQAAGLASPAALAAARPAQLSGVFGDDEDGRRRARAVGGAAKRAQKAKRAADDDGGGGGGGSGRSEEAKLPAPKRVKRDPMDLAGRSGRGAADADADAEADAEARLALPRAVRDEAALRATVLQTNRAPLVLAFAVKVLEATMPGQPPSSRLSLAQAVVSANSKTKAVSIGLERGRTAEEEGWGKGQPGVRVLGREVRVLRRMGYLWRAGGGEGEEAGEGTVKDEEAEKCVRRVLGEKDEDDAGTGHPTPADAQEHEIPLWGLDLEALKRSNAPPLLGTHTSRSSALPIHHPEGARAYLLKSFASASASAVASAAASPPAADSAAARPKKPRDLAAERERNLALLLGALELLVESWRGTLSNEELDRRAWGWYVRVRPDVEAGVAGWGGKGLVRLADVLDLRR